MAPHERCIAEKTLQELYTEKLLYHTRQNYDIINTREVNYEEKVYINYVIISSFG